MIDLWYSNSIEQLASLIAQNIEEERALRRENLLQPVTVLVPNLNVASYLKFKIAQITGIASNIRFIFLEKFLSGLVSSPLKPIKIIDRKLIQGLMINLFTGESSEQNLPKEIETYLHSEGLDADSVDLRRFQLASNLSRIFEEYGLSRQEMLNTWAAGRLYIKDERVSDIEKWQKELWRIIFGNNSILDTIERVKGTRFICHGGIAEAIRTDPNRSAYVTVHLFGFSYISRTFNSVLSEISKTLELKIYALNPSLEFWEDVMTRPESWNLQKKLISKSKKLGYESILTSEDPFHLDDHGDTPALRLWGRPGRENIHILNEITSCQFHAAFRDPLEMGPSLLRLIQHDILLREPERTVAPERFLDLSGDRSLRILECPEIRREAEIIANEIWSLMIDDEKEMSAGKEGDKLRFNDIAVVIADSANFEAYKTHITSAFSEIHDIPHNITDISFAGENRIIEGIDLLLSLPFSKFTRNDLLKVLSHPSLLVRFPEADPEEWLLWCQQMNIVHGADHTDHEGTYIEKDLFNWDQGLRRLVLGAFMSEGPAGMERTFEMGDPRMKYVPHDFSQNSLSNAALLVLLVRSLVADARYLKEAKLSLTSWAELLLSFVTSYLASDAPENEHIFSACLGEIAALRELDLDGGKVSYRIAKEFISASLGSIKGTKGQYLARGVTVSSFLPMRPIPFRVVFIAGLGEACFPAREMRDPLDLRSARRFVGDVSPRERDQYNFLETLILTKDRLSLSYVSRDSQTGEKLEPSSTIKELLFILGKGYLTEEQIDGLIIKHPLRRYDTQYFPVKGLRESSLPNFASAARNEATVLALKENLKSFLLDKGFQVHVQDLGAGVKKYLAARHGLMPAHPDSACKLEEPLQVPLSGLRQFLECPLQGWARFQIGLRDEDTENLMERIDEPFESERIDSSPFLRQVFFEFIKAQESKAQVPLSEIYSSQVLLKELKGAAPTGVFLEAEKKKHLATLAAWQKNFEALAIDPQDARFEIIRFGRAGEEAKVDRYFPAIPLEINLESDDAVDKKTRTDFLGKTGIVSLPLRHSLVVVDREKPSAKDFLKGYLDYLLLTLAGKITGNEYLVTVINSITDNPAKGIKTVTFSSLDIGKAELYVSTLLKEIVTMPHTYLLPIEAAVEYRLFNKYGKTLEEIVCGMRDNPRARYSSQYGPVPHPEEFAPPEEIAARSMVERRLGGFLNALRDNL